MGAHRAYRERRYAFAQQLLGLRTRAALTQNELAEQVGVHRRSVQNWETGEFYPKAETLQRLIAIFLRHQAFTQGQERTEAQGLWDQVAQDGPHPLGSFDDPWFAHTVATSAGQTQTRGDGDTETPRTWQLPTPNPQSPVPNPQPPFIDWGEVRAVSMLYGRECDLQTLLQWVVEDRCQAVAVVGLAGIGKSSLAITLARHVAPQFDVVLFRSLQNGPPLAELLDQSIRAISDQKGTPPNQVSDKIALLVQLLRERRCLIVLDDFEALMQPGALAGTYRTGYAEYGTLLQRLGEREHQSCLLLISREKSAELGLLESRTGLVRTLELTGLDDNASWRVLEAKDIVGTAADMSALARLYGGNPLALQLVADPIRELFGGNIGAFLAAGDLFFHSMGELVEQQLVRSTPLEQTIVYWLATERKLVPLGTLLSALGATAPQREVLIALESLRRRMLIERAPHQPAFTLQPVILECVTDRHLLNKDELARRLAARIQSK